LERHPCAAGVCTAGAPPACNDYNVCTTDSCVGGACQYAYNTNMCDDGNVNTVYDVCIGGVCAGVMAACVANLDCDDGNVWTKDSCSGGLCKHSYYTLRCDDGNAGTIYDQCKNGVCKGQLTCVTTAGCNDNNVCSIDTCSGGICKYNDNTITCNDGNASTINDRCSHFACKGCLSIGTRCLVNADCCLKTCQGPTGAKTCTK